MDKAPVGYTAKLSRLNNGVNVQSNHHGLHTSGLDARVPPNPLYASGTKRKWCDVDDSSVFLALGHSSSHRPNLSIGKETDDESSIDLSLSIDLHLGNRQTSCLTYGPSRAVGVKRSEIDLELSLSTGPAESDVTTVTQASSPCLTNLEALSLSTFQLGDEGSTSSRWKRGPLLQPFQSSGSFTAVNPDKSQTNPIQATLVVSSAALDTPKPSVSSASLAAHRPQRRTHVKNCGFEGCTRGARGASGLCIAHGGGRRCQKPGCPKGAEGKTVFCKAHGGGRRCQHLGCTKSAEGRTDFCIGHGGGRRCSHEGCTRAARGKSGLCIRHGGGKRCKMENCSKSAEGISGLCISHGGGRRCQYPACTKGAQGSTMFCKAHGGGKRCTFLGCTKGAEGSTSLCKGHGGGKRCTFEGCTKSVHGGTLFCVSHGGGKRCSVAGCTKSARGRTNFCVRHGGGKRCQFEGCTKSAQGRTDFCKGHGGGTRCSWGQVGSVFNCQAAVTCDKFARGKSGLCAAHAAQMQEKSISNAACLQKPISSTMNGRFTFPSGIDSCSGGNLFSSRNDGLAQISVEMTPDSTEMSVPEGRVHGGNLMAILRGRTSF
ncbi:OLC1v1027547C1 [Oldenlandia corymbosa var. corymbosa]|uniref:OLC1v1027547C1 n=1 Tax=Oldenlandia corymbosa var. corymbosa TaxID=529605 RepID=A0AAV1CA88_OLDCO|nr:OLC1v1027547C1 [Oldenlandia corymbosa var. corymbosa]